MAIIDTYTYRGDGIHLHQSENGRSRKMETFGYVHAAFRHIDRRTTISGISMCLLLFFAMYLCVAVLFTDASFADIHDNVRFERFTLDDGLSHSTVTAILQDSRGYLWFGTRDGLNRYDGYEYRVFRHEYNDPNSLSANFILSMYEDTSGILWIGTYKGGLNRYDPDTGAFERFTHAPDNPETIASNDVGPIVPDDSGNLWLGLREGLDRYDPDTGTFTHFRHDPADTTSLCCDVIFSLLHDSGGGLWIGTNHGLDRYDPDTGTFTHFRARPDNPHGLGNDAIHTLYETSDGTIWVGTEGGLFALDRESGRFTGYTTDTADQLAISDNIVLSLFESEPGILWIGTSYGLDIFDTKANRISQYHHDPLDIFSIGENWVKTICSDRTGILWFGTNGGVSKYNPRKSVFYHFRNHPMNESSLSANAVNGITGAGDGTIWIATDTGGLNHFDPETGEFTQYRSSRSVKTIPTDWVTAVLVDSDENVWAATGEGLVRIDPANDTIKTFEHVSGDDTTINSNWVLALYEDSAGSLWIGTGNGLNRMNRRTGKVKRHYHKAGDPSSLSHPIVRDIAEDETGNLWIGTDEGLNCMTKGRDGFERTGSKRLDSSQIITLHPDGNILWIGTSEGLCRYAIDSGDCQWTTVKDGLPNNSIVSIETDDGGNLWLGTNGGLAVMNTTTRSIRTYDVDDGLQSNQFSRNASWKTPDGELYFGGVNGFNCFQPRGITHNDIVPPVVVTQFLKLNDSSGPFSQISPEEMIRLDYNDNFFAIEFAALDYSSPRKNEYAYMLDGLDRDWIKAGNRRFASYAGIPPGEYTFRVRGTNSDGVWNEHGASVAVTITPPFWETAWFHMLVGMLILASITGGHFLRVHTMKNRQRELERLVAKRTGELERKTNELAAERKRLFSLLEALPAFVFLQDGNRVVRFVNSHLKEVFPGIKNAPCHKVFHRLNAPCEHCPTMTVFRYNEHLTREWTPSNGRYYQMFEYPFKDADGTDAVLKMAIDITERKQAEIDRISSEKMQVVLEMAGAASHEFTQPLQVISGHMELLFKSSVEPNETIRERLEKIDDQISRMKKITKKLQKITRYKTKDYVAGKKIIDIDGSVESADMS